MGVKSSQKEESKKKKKRTEKENVLRTRAGDENAWGLGRHHVALRNSKKTKGGRSQRREQHSQQPVQKDEKGDQLDRTQFFDWLTEGLKRWG